MADLLDLNLRPPPLLHPSASASAIVLTMIRDVCRNSDAPAEARASGER
jgi:hypothetical protein